MKLKREFISQNIDDTTFLVATAGTAFSGLVRGNKTFAAVLDALKTDTTEEQIVSALHARFAAPEGAIERDVKTALKGLREIGAIEE